MTSELEKAIGFELDSDAVSLPGLFGKEITSIQRMLMNMRVHCRLLGTVET